MLVITAQSDAQAARPEGSGAKDFVSKPFDLAEVLLRVHNMLEVRLLHLEALQLYDRVVSRAGRSPSGSCSTSCPKPWPKC